MKHFQTLNALNISGRTEKKNNCTYLSWAWAWGEVKKVYPDAQYKILKFNNLPYVCDAMTGYMVFTEVTIEETTHEMWLPVMDSSNANRAMKAEKYEYTTKYGKKTIEAATMFDINKTIMRCLTKNLAMFGLGLYIYAGEDIPEEAPAADATKKPGTNGSTPISELREPKPKIQPTILNTTPPEPPPKMPVTADEATMLLYRHGDTVKSLSDWYKTNRAVFDELRATTVNPVYKEAIRLMDEVLERFKKQKEDRVKDTEVIKKGIEKVADMLTHPETVDKGMEMANEIKEVLDKKPPMPKTVSEATLIIVKSGFMVKTLSEWYKDDTTVIDDMRKNGTPEIKEGIRLMDEYNKNLQKNKTSETGEVINPEQLKKLHTTAHGHTEIVPEVIKKFGYTSSTLILKSKFNEVLKAVEDHPLNQF